MFGHFGRDLSKSGAHGGREVEHLDPFRLDPDLLKGVLNVCHFFTGAYISFQEMTFTFQSPRDIYGVGTAFDRLEQMYDIDPPAARHLDHLDVGGIVQPHGTGQITGSISAVLATKSNHLRFKTRRHHHSFLCP
jgi:hypothetical protein